MPNLHVLGLVVVVGLFILVCSARHRKQQSFVSGEHGWVDNAPSAGAWAVCFLLAIAGVWLAMHVR